MQLSPERETELILQNTKKIYRAVDNFMAKCNQKYASTRITYDDCVQEVTIAFLEYIRRCETEDQLEKFPWYNAINALSKYVLRCQPLKVPITTDKFSEIIHSMPETVSYDVLASNGIDIDGMSKHWVPDTETKLDFDAFMSEHDEMTQRIVSMRLYGLSNRKIAAQYGVRNTTIDYRLKKLKKEYDEFDKEDEGNE